jgi:hypothetical protein
MSIPEQLLFPQRPSLGNAFLSFLLQPLFGSLAL